MRAAIVTGRATTLAEERALRPDGAGDDAFWWPRAGVSVGGAVQRAVPAASLPRLAERQRALEASAPHRAPRPGAGRAPTDMPRVDEQRGLGATEMGERPPDTFGASSAPLSARGRG